MFNNSIFRDAKEICINKLIINNYCIIVGLLLDSKVLELAKLDSSPVLPFIVNLTVRKSLNPSALPQL